MAKTKLKCWKRVNPNTFENKKTGEVIDLEHGGIDKNGRLVIGRWFIFKSKSQTDLNLKLIKGNFQTKSQALKFAKQYMKKHDKC